MAQQIKKKFIGQDQIDGSKIKLLEGQSLRGVNSQGQEVDLVKIGSQDKVEVLGQEVALKSELDSEVAALESKDQELDSKIAQEVLDRQSGDASTLASAQTYTDQKVAELVGSAPEVLDTLKELSDSLNGDANFAATVAGQIGSVDAKIESEISRAQSAEQALDQKINGNFAIYETEVGSLRSSITANSTAISQEIANRQTADSALGTRIDGVQQNLASVQTNLQTAINTEASVRQAADTALSARISAEEELTRYIKEVLYNDTAASYADGSPGVEDPSTMTRDGWYFQNSVAGSTINWYFFDGLKENVSRTQMKSAYAVMTFDDIGSKPIFGFYSYPTGSNDIMPGFAHSKWVYQIPAATMSGVVVGKKYLVWAGDSAPTAHPELPRLQATYVPAASGGDRVTSERILAVSLVSDPSSPVNKVKWMVQNLGIYADNLKGEATLKIKNVSKSVYNAKMTQLDSSISTLQSGLSSEISARQSAVSTEQAARIAGDASTLQTAKDYTNSQVLALQSTDSTLQNQIDYVITDMSNLMTELYETQNNVSNQISSVGSDLQIEKERIDAILLASTADKDSFAEIVSLINSVDTANDQAFAGYVTSNNAAVALKADKTYVDEIISSTNDQLTNYTDTQIGQLSEQVNENFDRSLLIDGTRGMNGNLIMGDVTGTMYKVVALGDGVDSHDAVNKGQLDSAKSELQTNINIEKARIDVLEAKGFSKGVVTVGTELAFIDLDRQYNILLSVSVGRLMIHEGEDFSVSVVDGKTRLTFIGSLVNPGGEEAIETGDKIFFSGAF